jgi:carbonic anhydrase
MSNQGAPDQVLSSLLAGNGRFMAGHPRFGHDVSSVRARTSEHHPSALVIGCLDSRVPPEAIFDQDFGTTVVVRTGGHALDAAVVGSVEFAVSVFEVAVVVVLGHQYCGAIQATVAAVRTGDRPGGALGELVGLIEPSVHEAADLDGGRDLADRVIDRHVARTVDGLLDVPAIKARAAAGGVKVVGARYQIDTGRVSLLESPA